MNNPCQFCKKYWPDCECEEYLRYKEWLNMKNRLHDVEVSDNYKKEELKQKEENI